MEIKGTANGEFKNAETSFTGRAGRFISRVGANLSVLVFSCCEEKKEADAKPTPSLNSVPIQLSASDLGKAYDNIVSADYNYKGRLLSVSGTLLGITRESDSIHVHLESNPGSGYVTCVFNNDRFQDLLLLKKGEQATVKGVCDGRQDGLSRILMHGCFIN
ncbi:MAG: OB-fold protein [Pyrinomonadaceae bacterium]